MPGSIHATKKLYQPRINRCIIGLQRYPCAFAAPRPFSFLDPKTHITSRSLFVSLTYRNDYRPRGIMSDDAYSSFLDQANQDTGASKESSSAKPVSATTVDTDVPIILQKLDQYYVSEADEPFKPVSFKWKGESLPSEGEQWTY